MTRVQYYFATEPVWRILDVEVIQHSTSAVKVQHHLAIGQIRIVGVQTSNSVCLYVYFTVL